MDVLDAQPQHIAAEIQASSAGAGQNYEDTEVM